MSAFSLYVRTMTGLEGLLAEELSFLGARGIEKKSRLVICQGDQRLLYQANIWCRTAVRVLRLLASFPATDEKTLYHGVRAVDWSQWMATNGTLAVNSTVLSSFSTHSLFLSQLVKDAVVDQFREKTGDRPSVDLEAPHLRIVLSLYKNQAQLYVDSSGNSLHRRGYRLAAGEAPLNECLAAGLVRLAGWNGATPFVDPMCGSGTIPIEAGLWVKNIAPGLIRQQFGFQLWPDYDQALYARLVNDAKAAVRPNPEIPILGFEIDPQLARAARENVERAGLADVVRIETGDFFMLSNVPRTPGVVIANPPYDQRLRVENIQELWQRIGLRLKQSFPGWAAALLCGNPSAVKFLALEPARHFDLFNGAIECRLFCYNLPDEPSPSLSAEVSPRMAEKAEAFANRLRKNFKHLSRWAKREGVSAYRVYDRDIPELPLIVDIYATRVHLAELQRNQEHSPLEHETFIELVRQRTSEVLGMGLDQIVFKKRQQQKSGNATGEFFEVTEAGLRWLVNLTDFTDTGLYLEQRKLRARIKQEAMGKEVLNLFAYTGALSVSAALGGAKSTTSVDSSRTYLEWAERNLKLNGCTLSAHRLVRDDAMDYLQRSHGAVDLYDLIVADPPVKSVQRATGNTFEVQSGHVALLRLALARLRPQGVLYFVSGARQLELDEQGVGQGLELTFSEITGQLITEDFARKPKFRCWQITRLINAGLQSPKDTPSPLSKTV